MHTSYMPSNEIEDVKRNAKSEALSFYDEKAQFGGKKIIQMYRKKLEQDIDQQLYMLDERNSFLKVITYKHYYLIKYTLCSIIY